MGRLATNSSVHGSDPLNCHLFYAPNLLKNNPASPWAPRRTRFTPPKSRVTPLSGGGYLLAGTPTFEHAGRGLRGLCGYLPLRRGGIRDIHRHNKKLRVKYRALHNVRINLPFCQIP